MLVGGFPHKGWLFLAVLVLATVASAQPVDSYQVAYMANYGATANGDDVINITNAGALDGLDPRGTICANIYVFDPAEELVACCSCPVTPNALRSLSAKQDLISNVLTPGTPSHITVAMLATNGAAPNSCNAANPTTGTLVSGMRAWATTLHAGPAGGYVTTENIFQDAALSASQLLKLTSYCNMIQVNGSSYGICKSCRANGLGAQSR